MPAFPALGPPEVTSLRDAAPGSADPKTCWRHDTVAASATATLFRASPQHDAPHAYWFRAPCPEQMTPARIASLQRALAARGLYAGSISGQMNSATQDAVQAYQAPLGLDSRQLSLAAARQMGLIDIGLED